MEGTLQTMKLILISLLLTTSKVFAGCPPISPKSLAECAGRQHDTCWSPGVRDLDCPGSSLCCFDGCANTCVGGGQPKAQPSRNHPEKIRPQPLPLPSIQTQTVFIPPAPTYVKPLHIKIPYHHHSESVKCPSVYPKSPYDCVGKTGSSCWSPGQHDVDCPNHSLCCFDGCANTCIQSPPKQTKNPNPCNPSPCGPGTTCTLNKDLNPVCQCMPGLIPKPDTITGCGPECVVDLDCKRGYVCYQSQCIEKPDPCDPSPCGSGTTCTTNNRGNPICNCLPGLIPKPDTITGCGPECVIDPDCPNNQICQNSKCIEKPDPCNPSPCGPGTTCTPNFKGNPVCQCLPGLIPKPDTITGCGPECEIDQDCNNGYICQIGRCIEKPDPCYPSPCGPGTNCSPNSKGNPVCSCLPGLIPKPDTITGCGVECVIDPDCQNGQICQNSKCIEKPDPCYPSPCGPGTTCTPNSNGNPVCQCLPGLIPKPDTITGCGPECEIDQDCNNGYICQIGRCIEKPDPCVPSPCGPGAECTVNFNGNPICRCLPGLIPKPDTITGCGPECTVDRDCRSGQICQNQRCIIKPDPCNPSPCGPGAFCTENINGNPVCQCEEGLIPKPDTITGCGPECVIDNDCQTGYICKNSRCMEKPDPCDPNPCGAGALCESVGHTGFRCKCPPGFFGDADIQCRKSNCDTDDDCSTDKFCDPLTRDCVNPCIMMMNCGDEKQVCKVVQHIPVCGYDEENDQNEVAELEPFVIGSRHSAPEPDPIPDDRFVIGARFPSREDTTSDSNSEEILSVARRRPRPRNMIQVIGAKYKRRKRKLVRVDRSFLKNRKSNNVEDHN